MDIAAVVSRFTDEEGNLAIPAEMSVPALCETLFQMESMMGDVSRTVMRGWTYSSNPDGEAEEFTRVGINTRIKAVAARLQQVAHVGDRVAILASNSPAYVYGFVGVMYAGMVPVPLYDPSEPGHDAHLTAVLGDCQPAVVLTAGDAAAAVRRRFAELPAAQRPRILAIDALPDSLAESWVSPDQTDEGKAAMAAMLEAGDSIANSVAFLQYTSGSTRTPAGVMITHRSVIANALQIYMAVRFKQPPRMVMWLPLHHDMGIILAVVFTVMGLPVDLMNPRDFLQHPGRWMRMISARNQEEHVYTAVPNFALELTARYGVPEDPSALDLSRVAGIFIGSEPIMPRSLEAFDAAFRPFGLAEGALKPGYGLAEATLLVSVNQSETEGAVIYHADREALSDNRVVLADGPSESTATLVSCGSVVRPQYVVIVDPETREELPAGTVGELWCHGENMAKAYLDRPEDTAATFNNTLAGRLDTGSHAGDAPNEGWMATGDLGVFVDDQLVITGRRKDLIVVAGRNHYPADIEYTADQATDQVAAGVVAAFAVPGKSSEELVVLAERDPERTPDGDDQAIKDIVAAITQHHGLTPAAVRILDPGTIARSSSGKIARQVNRKMFLADN